MVDVEVPVSSQLSTPSDGGPGIGNATMNDFTPRAQQVLALARKEAELGFASRKSTKRGNEIARSASSNRAV